jgi:hypothetical protein
VLAVVHDADHDRTRRGRNLDEIESGLRGGLLGLIEGDDADLFTVGSDETNGAEVDLIVDADFLFDAKLLP